MQRVQTSFVPTKKKPSAKDLKAAVANLQERLERAEARADRWKKKARSIETSAAKAEAQLKKMAKRLTKANAQQQLSPAETEPSRGASPARTLAPTLPPTASGLPDGTWTLAMLRAEARARGLAGYSRKSKAQLLAELG